MAIPEKLAEVKLATQKDSLIIPLDTLASQFEQELDTFRAEPEVFPIETQEIGQYEHIVITWTEGVFPSYDEYDSSIWKTVFFDTLTYCIFRAGDGNMRIEKLEGIDTMIYTLGATCQDTLWEQVVYPTFSMENIPPYLITGMPLVEGIISQGEILKKMKHDQIIDPLNLNDTLTYRLGRKKYKLFTTDIELAKKDSTNAVNAYPGINNLELLLSHEESLHTFYKGIIGLDSSRGSRFFYPYFRVLLQGDIDRDGKLDFIVQTGAVAGCTIKLYLSSQATEGELLKLVAFHEDCMI